MAASRNSHFFPTGFLLNRCILQHTPHNRISRMCCRCCRWFFENKTAESSFRLNRNYRNNVKKSEKNQLKSRTRRCHRRTLHRLRRQLLMDHSPNPLETDTLDAGACFRDFPFANSFFLAENDSNPACAGGIQQTRSKNALFLETSLKRFTTLS